MPDPLDMFTRPSPGSLMRAVQVNRMGLFRISRRDAELYSVQIVSAGSWGRIKVLTGQMRPIFEQPSTFTGSFWLGGCCEEGIIVELASNSMHDAANVTLNWRESDTRIV